MDNLTPEQIQSMIVMLQNMLPKDAVQNQENDFKVNNKKTSNKKIKSADKSVNKFNSMPEKNLHKDDTLIDKKLITQPPVPRARKFSLIKVVCRVCGKREEISPGLLHEAPDRYKCNKCSTSAG